MNLKEKLEKLKRFDKALTSEAAEKYKAQWKKDVLGLQNIIMFKWFEDYEKSDLMAFNIIPTSKDDPFVGEYVTAILEIVLTGNKYLVLEPITSITTELDGKLEFYMRGNFANKVNIARKLIPDYETEWYVLPSNNLKDNCKLNKAALEKIIEEWLK